jgi:hypothetical protein
MQYYVGNLRLVEKPWGKEYELSLSEKDLRQCLELLYKGWVKIGLKKQRTPKEDKVGYGLIFVPDNAVKGSQGHSEAPTDDDYFSAGKSERKAEDIPDEPDMTENLDGDDENLPF